MYIPILIKDYNIIEKEWWVGKMTHYIIEGLEKQGEETYPPHKFN